MYKQATHTTITLAIVSTLAIMGSSLATAGSVTVTNTFATGQPATAASVNQNFTDVKTAVDDNDGRITTNTSNVTTNTGNISTNTGAISTNTGALATNTGAIATNTGDIATNAGAIGDNTSDIGLNTTDIGNHATDISTNESDIADHETRITTLEGAGGGGGGSPTSADNTAINVTCPSDSLQAAIDAAPLHGRTEIIINGACTDDIFLRRSDITLRGMNGPGSDSITGDATGYDSDTLLVQRNLSGALEIDHQAQVLIKDLTIHAGSNEVAVMATHNASLKLENVTLDGGSGKYGLLASNADVIFANSTVTGGTAAADPAPGSAVMARNNSAIELQAGNIFNGANGDTVAFVALSGSSINWTGGSNVINAGAPIDINEDEPEALAVALNSSLLQLPPASPAGGTEGNVIDGAFAASESSSILMHNVAIINCDFFEAFAGSTVSLQPRTAGAITVAMTPSGQIEAGNGSTLDFADQDAALVITGGQLLRLLDHSTLLLFSNGSTISMDVEMSRSSSIDGGDGVLIDGNLEIGGFSSAVFTDQAAAPISGSVTTGFGACQPAKAEAFWFDQSDNYNELCP